MATANKLGLIQSRGIGDIIIALPIAKYFHDRGLEVYWPIDESFYPSFSPAVDYVRFLPFKFEPTPVGFLLQPMELLKDAGCARTVSLYSYLSFAEINNPALFHSLKFDEYKYAIAGVPFEEKWKLSIKRNRERERKLFNQVVQQRDYIVVHRHGSNVQVNLDIPKPFQRYPCVEIDERTDNIFDWLMVLERAKFLLMIDSCFSNLVEQMNLRMEKVFILRSEARYTPVLRNNWRFSSLVQVPAPKPASTPRPG